MPSLQDLRTRLGDVELWTPYVEEVLSRHGLLDGQHDVVAGSHPTYPTFVRGDAVVKLFGCDALPWSDASAAERAGLELAGTDPGLRAPTLLATGLLRPDDVAPWPYLVLGRVGGKPVWAAGLDRTAWSRWRPSSGPGCVACTRLRRRRGIPTDHAWSRLDVPAAVAHSSLPDHLVRQVAAFLAAHPLQGQVVVHGDVIENHVHVDDDGNVVGVIDWGDVAVTDPHYELAQIHRDLFDCDVRLLRTLPRRGVVAGRHGLRATCAGRRAVAAGRGLGPAPEHGRLRAGGQAAPARGHGHPRRARRGAVRPVTQR